MILCITDKKYKTSSLTFERFQLDFVVDLDESIKETGEYSRAVGSKFTFVRGETWLLLDASRYLVFDRRSNGNLLETLRAIATKLKALPQIESGKYSVDCGSWGKWMRAYWDRFLNDNSVPDDEPKHDYLIGFLLDEGQGGVLAAYKLGLSAVFEVCLPSKRSSREPVVEVWSYFDALRTVQKIEEIRSEMSAAVNGQLGLDSN